MNVTNKLVIAAAAAAALVSGTPAFAAYTPRLTVNGHSQATGGGGGVAIRYAQAQPEDATAKLRAELRAP